MSDFIDYGGIGTCPLGENTWLKKHNPMLRWSHAKRNCDQFENNDITGE